MTGMEPIPPEVAEKSLRVANVVHDVFSSLFPSNSAHRGLETSRWASQGVVQQTGPNPRGLTDSKWAPKENNTKDPEAKLSPSVLFTPLSSSSPPSTRPRRLLPQAVVSAPSSSHTSSGASFRASPGKTVNMHRPANVDDTVAFMAAARALNQNSQSNASPSVNDASNDLDGQFKTSTSPIGSPTAAESVPSSASSSLSGNAAGSPGLVSPAVQDVPSGQTDFSKPSGSFVGRPTAPEFVPSSPSSLAGNPGGSQGSLSPMIKGMNGQQSPKASSFVGNPAADEFVPSPASSSAGNLLEDFGSASTAKEEKIPDCSLQNDTGIGNISSKPQPINPVITSSEREKVIGNVNDTVGFMAAARALRQTHDISSAINVSTSSPNVEEPSIPIENSAGFIAAVQGIEQQNQAPAMSPAKDFFTPTSSKVEKTVGFMAATQDSEHTSQLPGAPPSMNELMSATSSKKLDKVDDTVGFMAAARSLRRTPGMSLGEDITGEVSVGLTATTQDADKMQSSRLSSASPAVDPKENQVNGEADDMSRFMSPVEHFVSAATSPETKTRGDMDDSASTHTVRGFSEPAPTLSFETNGNPTASSNGTDVTAQQTSTPRSNGFAPESPQEKRTASGVDDTNGFMAAVRALKERRQASSFNMPPADTSTQEKISDYHGAQSNNDTVRAASPVPDAIVAEDEDRENMTTFKTWGPPAPRYKPASQVRRIILTGLPSTWTTPTKVLSLIHGGAIERVSVAPSGNAHVLFCEHEDCKAFYEKYPNGIGLGPHNVFVEIGQEVDVVSSQLTVNRSVGATRIVRAVGVDLDITMVQLNQMASGCNRKVEKILDNYSPDDVRTVIFRFCNLDDAVRFRSQLVRHVDWEACNVQYGNDPCEMATGYHAD